MAGSGLQQTMIDFEMCKVKQDFITLKQFKIAVMVYKFQA